MPKRNRRRASSGKLPDYLKAAAGNVERFLVGQNKGAIMLNVGFHKTPHPKTIMCIQNLMHTFAALGTGHDLMLRLAGGSDVVSMRNLSASDLLDIEDSKGMLFIDDDMKFPGWTQSKTAKNEEAVGFNALERLLSRDKDIVAALCTTRGIPMSVNAGYENKFGEVTLITDTKLIDPLNDKPFKVDYVGFGMIYVSRRAFERIERFTGSRKFFDQAVQWRFLPDIDKLIEEAKGDTEKIKGLIDHCIYASNRLSEDFSFCQRARAAGLEIWIDPTFDVRHIGDYEYSRWDYCALKNAEEEEKRQQKKTQAAAALAAQAQGD